MEANEGTSEVVAVQDKNCQQSPLPLVITDSKLVVMHTSPETMPHPPDMWRHLQWTLFVVVENAWKDVQNFVAFVRLLLFLLYTMCVGGRGSCFDCNLERRRGGYE